MLVYKIREGSFYRDGLLFLPDCYSGHGDHKNDPRFMNLSELGPLPQGAYGIGTPFEHPRCGKYCLRLTALPGTEMYGRGGMLVHGDSSVHPGEASDGCIVSSGQPNRAKLFETGEKQLIVLAHDY